MQGAASKISGSHAIDLKNKNLLVRVGIITSLIIIILSIPSHNFGLTIVSLLPIPLFVYTLWRPGEPSVLFFAIMFQWLSITIKVFYGNIIGADFRSLHEFPLYINDAFYLNLYGLIFLVFGISFVLRRIPSRRNELDEVLENYDTKMVIIFYLIYVVIIGGLFRFRFDVPGLFQGIVALNKIKLGLIFFVLYMSFRKKDNRILAVLVVSIEFFLGFLSFFSNFKEVIIISFITYLALHKKISLKLVWISIFILFLGFNLGIVWTVIKGEYRFYLAGEERSQKIVVDKYDAFFKLNQLISEYDVSDKEKGIRSLIDRISYIDHFSACLEYVPESAPHEKGKLWMAALNHMITPRLFYPNKPAVDDSQHLMKYTGMIVADASMGTSISLGYMGDSYIDFGRTFMVIPIFLLGLIIGYVYRNLFLRTRKVIWSYVLIVPLFELSYNLGVTSIKMISELILFFLTAILFRLIVIPYIDPLLKRKKYSSGK